MRLALVSLFAAAAAFAGAVQAQPTDTTTQAAPAATAPAATPPPATDAAPPASTPPAATPPAETPPAATPPAAPESATPPATPPAPPAAAGEPTAPATTTPTEPPPPPPPPQPPPPPPPPTDPMAIRILDTLERVCVPATATGGNLDQLARAAGFHRSRDSYNLRQGNLNFTIQPLSANHLTCTMEIEYPVDTLQPTIVAVHNWAMGRGMTLRDPYRTTSDLQRDIRSWERDADALVLLALKKADGTPVLRNADRAQVIFQRRTQ